MIKIDLKNGIMREGGNRDFAFFEFCNGQSMHRGLLGEKVNQSVKIRDSWQIIEGQKVREDAF